MTHDEMIAVIKAHKEGKTIQYIHKEDYKDWKDRNTIANDFNFAQYLYRVKPEPQVLWINKNSMGEYIIHSSKKKAEEMASVFGSKTYKFVEEL